MDKNVNTILKGVGILMAVGGLYVISKVIIGKVKVKKQDEIDEKLAQEITGQLMSPNQAKQEKEEAKKYNPSAHSKWIREAIDGVNYNNSDAEQTNKTIMSLSDAKLKKIAPYYKSKYGISLWKDLDNEWDNCSKGLFEPYENCFESSMRRLTNLNLI